MAYVKRVIVNLLSVIFILYCADYTYADVLQSRNIINTERTISEGCYSNRIVLTATNDNKSLIDLPNFDDDKDNNKFKDISVESTAPKNSISDMNLDVKNSVQLDIEEDARRAMDLPQFGNISDDPENKNMQDLQNIDFDSLIPEIDQAKTNEEQNASDDLSLPTSSVNQDNTKPIIRTTPDANPAGTTEVVKSKDAIIRTQTYTEDHSLNDKQTDKVKADNKMLESESKNMQDLQSDKMQKFLTSEEQLLTNPLDDIIFGRINRETKHELEDFRLYVDKIYHKRKKEQNFTKGDKANKFLSNYANRDKKHDVLFYKKIFSAAIQTMRQKEKVDKLSILVNNYLIIHLKDKDGNNLLHHAVMNNNLDSCKLLLKKGINTQELNNKKKSPLMLAYEHKHTEIIQLLKNAEISNK